MKKSLILLTLFALFCVLIVKAQENQKLKDKTVFITGATSGIGKAAAEYLASKGLNVVLFGRRLEKGKAVEEEINAKGKGKALFVVGDVTSAKDQEKALSEGAKKFGSINFAIANAGVAGIFATADVTDVEVARKVIDVNLIGSLITLQESAKYFKQNEDGGAIVYTSSIASSFGRDSPENEAFAVIPIYTISKETQNVLARVSASLEKTHKIRSYSMRPALFKSEMADNLLDYTGLTEEQQSQVNPLVKGRAGDPRDLGRVVEACFDGTTKYRSGTSFVCDHFLTWPSSLYYQTIEGGKPLSKETLMSEARNVKGERIELTQEKLELIIGKKLDHDEL